MEWQGRENALTYPGQTVQIPLAAERGKGQDEEGAEGVNLSASLPNDLLHPVADVDSGATTAVVPEESVPTSEQRYDERLTPEESEATIPAIVDDEPFGPGGRKESIAQRVGINHGIVAASLTMLVRDMLESHQLSDRHISKLVEEYVPAKNFAEIVGILTRFRVTVIVADRDQGRHDAAVNALNRLVGSSVRELVHKPGAPFETSVLRTVENCGWLLDLREDSKVHHSLASRISSPDISSILEEKNSYLCIIVSASLWALAGEGARHLTKSLEPATSSDLFQSRLKLARPEIEPKPWVEDVRIAARLTNRTPSEVKLLAERVIQAQHIDLSDVDANSLVDPVLLKSDPQAALQELRARVVLAAFSDWRHQLLDWHKKNRDVQRQCFLLAAAVLEELPVLKVFEEIGPLAKFLTGKKAPTGGLTSPGIIELVDIIGAQPTDDLRLEFTRPGYGDAVLDYFWVDRQPLQDKFLQWMTSVPVRIIEEKNEAAARKVTDRIATYALRWTVRNRSFKVLTGIAEAWGVDPRFRETVIELFTASALHPDLGPSARRQMLEWSKPESNASVSLKLVIAAVCAGPLSTVYPTLMLRRLGHLGESTEPEVASAVGEAMRQLWQYQGVRSEVVAKVRQWLSAGEPNQFRVGRSTFFTLAQMFVDDKRRPALLDESVDLNTLALGWRSLLQQDDLMKPVNKVLTQWLDAAMDDETCLARLGDVLRLASAEKPGEAYDARAGLAIVGVLYNWVIYSKNQVSERVAFARSVGQQVAESDPLRRVNLADTLPVHE